MVFKKGNIPHNIGKKTPECVIEKIKLNAKTNPNFGMKGKHFSEETKDKISLANKGKTRSEEEKRKMSERFKGRIFTKEHLEKLSKALTGKKKSPEHIINIRKSKDKIRGKTYEELYGEEKAKEIKEKLSILNSKENNNMFGKIHSIEAREKISKKNMGKKSWCKGLGIRTIKRKEPTIKVGDKQYYIAHFNWMKANQIHRIPFSKERGKNQGVIHHIDGNQFNNEPENLQLMTKDFHSKLHSQYNKSMKGDGIAIAI